MSEYRQNLEAEMWAMIVVWTIGIVVTCGVLWALVFMARQLF